MSNASTKPVDDDNGPPTAQSATRDKILAAATLLFELSGPHSVTTRQIAAAAGVNSQLIYYYFRDKDGLFDAALEQAGGRVGELLDAAARDGGAVREQLARFIVGWVATTLAEAPAVRMLHRAMLEGNSVLSTNIQRFAGDHGARIADMVAKGIFEGAFRSDVDPDRAVASLVGMVQYLALAEPYLPPAGVGAADRATGAQEAARHTAELFLRGLDAR